MNKQKLGETVGKRVLLKPRAKYFNAAGQFEVSQPDIWIVQRKTDEGICLENSNRISFSLPADHVHHFATEMPNRDSHGTLLLTSQVRVDEWKVSLEPGLRPGTAQSVLG
jgi:hypothetical protein